jgi:hypothetical protein
LLITIVLLSLLVLVLVGLASFTRVETQVAGNSQQLSQARKNAVMALNIAIGELQRATGPDQRATARADLGESAPAFRYNASDKLPLVAPQDGTRHWTSAWGQQDDPTNPGWQQNPVLLNWLVSGNEGRTFTADTTSNTAYNAGGTLGLITTPPPAAPAFGPDSPVTGAALASLVATQTGGQIQIGGRPAALLVGPATVGSGNTASYVVAPLVNIEADNGTIPGLGTTGQTPIGRYAFWIGDEGVKARANLLDPWRTPANAEQARAGFATAQRFAIERMAIGQIPAAGTWDALYPIADPSLARVLDLPQLTFASANPTGARAAASARYHDLTTHTLGVLADQRSGGLKRELDRELFSPTASSPNNTTSLFRRESTDTVTAIGLQSYRVPPTWGRLRNWYSTRQSSGAALAPAVLNAGGSDVIPIGPVITWAELAFGAYYEKNVPSSAAPNYQGTLRLYPRVALWNPYNAPLAGRRYEIGFGLLKNGSVVDDMSFILRDATRLIGANAHNDSRIEGSDWRMSNGVLNDANPQKQFITFVIDCPDLEPGETRWFSLTGVDTYTGVNILGIGDRSTACVQVPGPVIAGTPPELGGSDALAWGHRYRPWGGDAEIYLREDGLPPVLTPNFPTRGTLAPSDDHRFFQYIQGLNVGGSGTNPSTFRDPAKTTAVGGQPEEFTKTYNLLGEGPFAASANPQFKAVWATQDIPRNYLRWLANGNPRATLSGDSGAGRDGGAFRNSANWDLGDKNATHRFNFANLLTDVGSIPATPFIAGGEISSGLRDYALINGRANRTTLFERPAPGAVFTSIAQLQHAHLSDFSVHPAYPVGNSLADPRLPRGTTFQRTSNVARQPAFRTAMHGNYHHYDLAYRLNASLWDRYFFSSIYAAGSTPTVASFPAPNSLLVPYAADAGPLPTPDDSSYDDPALAASKLLLAGGFNVNSTSEQAWLALLASRRGVRYDPQTGNVSAPPAENWTPFSRLSRPSENNRDPTKGYRYLTGGDLDTQVTGARGDEQLAALAKAIVAEVKARGPFVSLSQFVNRELVPAPTANSTGNPMRQDNSLKGALQAAIDRDTRTLGTSTNLNINRNASLATTAFRFTDANWHMAATPGAPTPSGNANYNLSYAVGEGGNNGESMRGIVGTEASLGANNTSLENPALSKHAFLPGFITQADLLAALGPVLTARSDTFTIRTYGETTNPATGETDGRAWLEAVVQRFPDYIDQSDPALTSGPALGAATPPEAVNPLNRQFGRRYRVVSIRWLSPSDI